MADELSFIGDDVFAFRAAAIVALEYEFAQSLP